VLDKIAWFFDEPFADSSAVPTWYVCKMARQNVTVALSGDGGDESFGGYDFRYMPHFIESKIRAVLPAVLRHLVFGPLGAYWPGSANLPKPLRLKTIFENLAVNDVQAFYRDLIWLRSDKRKLVYTGDFLNDLHGFTPLEFVHPIYDRSDANDALGRSQYTDLHFYLVDDILVKVDRMSMAHSLEVRSPLLDYRIIEFAASLSASMKMNCKSGKLLLRSLASKRVPPQIAKGKKTGFTIPAARWLRNELRPFIEEVVFNKTSMIYQFLKKDELDRLWGEHLSNSRDHSVFLWAVLMLWFWEKKHWSPS
jgi:asparagine synthase (glutamine-hydrolysing)